MLRLEPPGEARGNKGLLLIGLLLVYCCVFLLGAICRVVSLVPEFILTNALPIPLFFRQYGTQGPSFEGAWRHLSRAVPRVCFVTGLFVFASVALRETCPVLLVLLVLCSVHPGQSYPVYFASSELPQAIQFRPGTGEGYAWSGAVVASEETAGKSWIALYNGIRDAAPGKQGRPPRHCIGL